MWRIVDRFIIMGYTPFDVPNKAANWLSSMTSFHPNYRLPVASLHLERYLNG
jgi:hypothetical protein